MSIVNPGLYRDDDTRVFRIEDVKDLVTQQRILTLHPMIRHSVIRAICHLQDKSVFIRIVQALRSLDDQMKIYAQGRTAPGEIVTWAQPGMSYHNYGLALDFCLLHADKQISWSRSEDLDADHIPDWTEVVDTFKAEGFAWGGEFPKGKEDYPHFQMSFGKRPAQLLSLVKAKKVDAEGFILWPALAA